MLLWFKENRVLTLAKKRSQSKLKVLNLFSRIYRLRTHEGFIRHFKNLSWMLGEQLLRIVSGLFVSIMVARYLGPKNFGLFNYVLAYIAIFSGIARLGLDDILVRELISAPEKRDTYLGTAFWLKTAATLIIIIIIWAISPFTTHDNQTSLFVLIVSGGLLFQSFEVVGLFFQSQVKAKIISICKVIQITLSSLIKVYLVISKAKLIYFLLVAVGDAFALAVSYFVAYRITQKEGFYGFLI